MGVRSGPRIPSESREEGGNLLIHGNVGAGQVFVDSSPSRHVLTANGNTTHSTTQSKFDGGSIAFDGTGDYLNVADSTDWEFGNGIFTIDFWFKNNSTAASRGVISIAQASGDYYENILVYTASSGTILVLYSSSNNTWDIASAANMGAFGSDWTHYAIVRESVAGDIKLYNNGTLQTTVSTSATLRAVDTFRIGQRVSHASNGASCYLDEIRITKGTARWTENFKPPHRRYVTRDLVLSLDAMNAKSFAGEPTSNLCTSRISDGAIAFSAQGTNSPLSLTVASDTTETPFGNTAYKLTFASGSGKGTGYAAERATTANWAVDAAKTYSYGLWIAFNSDYAKSRVDGDHVNTYITGSAGMSRFSGGYNDASPTYIDAGGKRWYHYGRTARSIGASGSYNEFWAFFRNNSHFTEEVILWVAGPQFEEGSSFTPYTSTSRAVANSWKDISGNGNHGTHSAEDFGNADDVSLYKKGQIMLPVGTTNITSAPASINFDGSNDLVSTSFGVGLNPTTTLLSYALWVYPDTASGGQMFMAQSSWGAPARAYFGQTGGYWGMGIQGSGWGASQGGLAVVASTWYHIVIVFDGSNAKWYQNGNHIFDKAYTSYAFDMVLAFGNGSTFTSGYPWNGKIATCAIHKAALTHAQVKDMYNSQRSRFGL